MKWKNCYLLVFCASILLINCGKDGDNGKDGTNGKTSLIRTSKEGPGANCPYGGNKVETGIDVNGNGTLDDNEVITTQTKYVCDGAGATYSSWIDVNVVDINDPSADTTFFNFKQTITAPSLTASIVNNGIVLMYYKNKLGAIYPVEDATNIMDFDKNGTSFWMYLGLMFKERSLTFLASAGNKDWINDNNSAIRYVLVPGSVQGRNITDLKKMPYDQVAKLFNIQD